MNTTLVRFITKDNLRLDGLLWYPTKPTTRVIIHVHGTAGNFYENLFLDTMHTEFTAKGWAFLAFNNRGANDEGAQTEIFEDCETDIVAAIEFCKKQGFTEIVLQGHSYGCNKVTWYALQTGFAGKIVLLAPCDMVAIKREAGETNHCWKARDDKNLDMFRYGNKTIMPELAKIKNDILVEMGTNDPHIAQDKRDCIKLITKSFPNARVTGHIIADADHSYRGFEEDLVRNITTWLLTS